MTPVRPELPQLLATRDYRALWSYLESRSNLPGPRANLALLNTFADAAVAHRSPELFAELDSWLATPLIDSPVNTPAEFPVACSAAGLASFVDGNMTIALDGCLRKAAHDVRWRTREALVLGLQRTGQRDAGPVITLATRWASTGDPFLERAAISTLAHQPLLNGCAVAETALDLTSEIIDRLQTLPSALRKTEGNRVLEKALGFAISVFVAEAPEIGFPHLERWLMAGDKTTRRIINENLGKARLSGPFGTEVANLKGIDFELDDWDR